MISLNIVVFPSRVLKTEPFVDQPVDLAFLATYLEGKIKKCCCKIGESAGMGRNYNERAYGWAIVSV